MKKLAFMVVQITWYGFALFVLICSCSIGIVKQPIQGILLTIILGVPTCIMLLGIARETINDLIKQ